MLGTHGVGLTAQLSTFAALVGTVSALGVGTGGMKVLAEERGRRDDAEQSRIISLLVWAPFGVGLLAWLLTAAFAGPLSLLLLGDRQYDGLLIVAMSALPLSCLVSSLQVVMQGYELASRLSVNSIVTAVFTTVLAIPLTIAYDVTGAVAAIPLSALATVVFFLLRERWVLRRALPLAWPSRRTRRTLVHFAGASIGASALGLGADAVLRSFAVHQLGIEENGLYQPAQMFSSVLLAQLAGTLALVLLPRLSYELARDHVDGVLATLRGAGRSAVVLAVPLCLLSAALSQVFIVVFFNRSFLPVAGVLAVQSVSELPRFLAYVVGAVLLPAGHVRAWFTAAMLALVARLALGFALVPVWGLYGLAVSFLAQWVVVLAYTWSVLRRRFGWRGGVELTRLLWAGGVLVLAGLGLSVLDVWGCIAAVALAAGWLAVVGRGELATLLGALPLPGSRRRAAA